MRRFISFSTFFILFSIISGCAGTQGERSGPVNTDNYSGDIRVACVGNSITFGSGIQDREQSSYPAQLDDMLGDNWEVRNFGVSGATMLKNGDKPYWDQEAFQQALDFDPHVVIIKLGTNDSKPINWKFRDEFIPDYRAMVQQFEKLPSNPRIWICLPVPAYEVRWGIRNHVITEEVIPRIRATARAEGIPTINLYAVLDEREELFPDKIHPNTEGAREMAKKIYEVLTGETYVSASIPEFEYPLQAVR
ncbi:MAG: hypothetical protein GF372_07965 [Candidatus Marinimicrobia bacterium]|nr:hypothetical protein [Candidatus Neomarinimicrobiota bacterium]